MDNNSSPSGIRPSRMSLSLDINVALVDLVIRPVYLAFPVHLAILSEVSNFK